MARTSEKEWILTEPALNKLLSSINTNLEVSAQKYIQIQEKLIKFFEYQGCLIPEEQADETINRVIKKIDQGEVIAPENINKYIHSVSVNVLREYWRKKDKQPESLEQLPTDVTFSVDPKKIQEQTEEKYYKEKQLECLELCLQSLEETEQTLIYDYYQKQGREGIENRGTLAQKMGIPLLGLRVKIHRLREKLERCVTNCVAK